MTREHKLALIVGFTLVLVVGVLISDHFSKARTARVGGEIADSSAERFGSGTSGLRPVGLSPAGFTAAMQTGQMGDGTPGSVLPPVRDPIGHGEVATIRMGERLPSDDRTIADNFEEARDRSTHVVIVPESGSASQPLGPGIRPVTPGHSSGADPDASFLPGENGRTPPGLRTNREEDAAVAPSTAKTEPPKRDTIMGWPVEMCTRHDVREGESVFRIAKDKYGDGALWTKLRDFNKGKIGENGAMREGVTLLLPPKDALLGKAAPSVMPEPSRMSPPAAPIPGKLGAPQTKPAKPEVRPDTAIASKSRTYTVQRGDVLSDVARKTLGSSKRWMEIHDLNRDMLDDENTLQVGMVLKLPAR